MIDKRDRLKESPFDYEVTKAGKVFIYWMKDGSRSRIKILSGQAAAKFLRKIENKSEFDVQMALAKITGHFKHGNERG